MEEPTQFDSHSQTVTPSFAHTDDGQKLNEMALKQSATKLRKAFVPGDRNSKKKADACR